MSHKNTMQKLDETNADYLKKYKALKAESAKIQKGMTLLTLVASAHKRRGGEAAPGASADRDAHHTTPGALVAARPEHTLTPRAGEGECRASAA